MAFNKLNLSKFFGMTDDEFDDQSSPQEKAGSQQTERAAGKSPVNNRQKVVSMNAAPAKASKIVIFEPRIYSDVKEAASHLLNSRAVVISFNRIDQTQAKRIVDFLTGTVFAINGDIERIGDDIFLCTPANFEIDGNLSDILRQDGLG